MNGYLHGKYSLAQFHAAIPTTEPVRTPEGKFVSRRRMPADSTGQGGAERLTRYGSATRYEAGSNATCIDFFNADLVPSDSGTTRDNSSGVRVRE